MMMSRLLAIFLLLLQSGLAVAHVHHHSDSVEHPDTPHIHACEMLKFLTPAHSQSDEEDQDSHGTEHDADAVELADVLATAPPSVPVIAVEFTPIQIGLVPVVDSALLSFPLGLPPSTAGPHLPLYVQYCSFLK